MIQYIIGDNNDLIKSLKSDTISLSITSPPYKNEDGFHSLNLDSLFKEMYRVHKNNTLFWLNFGHLANFKERPFHVLFTALGAGWKLNDTITWTKTQYSPIQGKRRLNNLTEFIFLLYKGNMPELDRLSIGIPYADKSNIGRYSDNDLKCRGNNWVVGYETIQSKNKKLHNDRFPLDIPKMCIKLSGLKDGTILEPYAGSGTTLIAAKQLGFDAIGFEKNEIYKEVFEERLKQL